MKAIAEFAPPKTYTEIRAFLGLVGHYRRFIKGFARIAQPLNEHLTGEGACRKAERVSLSKEALKAFKTLKQACMNTPVLAFANYTKEFLLETNASKQGLGAILSQKQEDGQFHPDGLWQLGTYHTRKELPFYKTRVSGIEVGHYGALQRVSAIPTLRGED